MPDVPREQAPSFVELQFDPAAMPARSYEPTSLALSVQTGLIDLSSAGIDVPGVPADPSAPVDPTACREVMGMSVAQCEFYQYLERLDGFPSLASGKTVSSAALDLSSVTRPQNLFIHDVIHDKTVTDVAVRFDEQNSALLFDPSAGWDIGAAYVVGIRGYANGVRDTNGAGAVASTIYVLLKRETSLTCGAVDPEAIDVMCDTYALLERDARFAGLSPTVKRAAIGSNLFELERLRRFYRGELSGQLIDTWDVLSSRGAMPKEEVAIAWTFGTHSGSVVELDPQRGLVPAIASEREIRLRVKGSLDPSSLRAFSLAKPAGSVFLFDVDKLQVNPTDPAALPPFAASFADGEIVLTTTDSKYPFIEGDTYAVLLTNEVTNTSRQPLVASPITVLLRTRGPLTDGAGVSQVGGVADDAAQQLEAGRLQFAALLDNPLIQAATVSAARPMGLVREQLVYLYAFPFKRP